MEATPAAPAATTQVLTSGLALRNFHKGNSGGVAMRIDAMGLDAHAAKLTAAQLAAATAKARQITAWLLAHARSASR